MSVCIQDLRNLCPDVRQLEMRMPDMDAVDRAMWRFFRTPRNDSPNRMWDQSWLFPSDIEIKFLLGDLLREDGDR